MTAHGTWKFTNGQDSGTWSGRKVSSETTVPGMTTTNEQTETTTTASSSETTSPPPNNQGGTRCGIVLDNDFLTTYDAVIDSITKVLGSKPECYSTQTTGQQNYVFFLNITSVDATKIQEYLLELTSTLQSHGLTIHVSGVTGNNEITIMATNTFNDKVVSVVLLIEFVNNMADISLSLGIMS